MDTESDSSPPAPVEPPRNRPDPWRRRRRLGVGVSAFDPTRPFGKPGQFPWGSGKREPLRVSKSADPSRVGVLEPAKPHQDKLLTASSSLIPRSQRGLFLPQSKIITSAKSC